MNLDVILRAVVQGREAIAQLGGDIAAVGAESEVAGHQMDDLSSHQTAAADTSKVLSSANIDVAARMAEARVRAENLTSSLKDHGVAADDAEKATQRLMVQLAKQSVVSDFAKAVRDSGESMRVLGPTVRGVASDLVNAQLAADNTGVALSKDANAASSAGEGAASAGAAFGALIPVLIGVGVAAAAALSPWILWIAAGAAAVVILGGLIGIIAGLSAGSILLANATGQVVGPMQQLAKTAKDAADALGKELAPIARDFIGLLNQMIPLAKAALDPFIAEFQQLMPVLLPIARTIGVDLINALSGLGEVTLNWAGAAAQLWPQLSKLFELLLSQGVAAVAGLLDNLLRLSEWFLDRLPSMGPQVGTVFSLIGTAVQKVAGALGSFVDWVTSHWSQIVSLLEYTGHSIQVGFQFVAPVIGLALAALQKLQPVLDFIRSHADELRPILLALGGLAAIMAASFLLTVGAVLLVAGAFVGLFLIGDKVVNWLKTAVPAAIHAVGDAFSAIGTTIQRVIGWFGNLFSAIGTFFNNILTKAEDAWSQFTQRPIYWIGYLVSYVPIRLVELYGRFTAWVGQMIVKGDEWGMQMVARGLDAAQRFVNAVDSFLSQLPGRVAGWLWAVIQQIPGWIGQLVSWATSAGSSFLNALIRELQSAPGQFLQIGRDIAQGVINGITGMISAGVGAVGQFVHGLLAGGQAAAQSHSPSLLFANELGVPIAQGIALGIQRGAPTAHAAISSVITSMAGGAPGVSGTAGVGGISLGLSDTNDILQALYSLLDERLPLQGAPQPFRRHSLAST